MRKSSLDTLVELVIELDNNYEMFQMNINVIKILRLNEEFKKYEKKGYIKYNYYNKVMRNIFDNKNSGIYDNIFNLLFDRFCEIKCIIKNNKEVFYLTKIKKENYISSYKLLCALIVFLYAKFEIKLELLFRITDLDEDGLIGKNEIKKMITTVNHLFVEEMNTLKTDSSILSQSLINLKVENILGELFHEESDINQKLKMNNNYIDYNTFYQCIIKINNYKYKLIPCFINFKECLFSKREEKIIKIKPKLKKDFINISTSFISEQCQYFNNSFKLRNYSKYNLNDIIQPIQCEYKNNNEKISLKTNISLKSFIKNNSTILDNNKESEKNNNTSFKNLSLAFQAKYDDIKSIEVEPGIIQIGSNEEKKDDDNGSLTFLDTNEFFNDKNNMISNKNNNVLTKNNITLFNKYKKKNILKSDSNINSQRNIHKSIIKLTKNKVHKNLNTTRIKNPSLQFFVKKKKLNNILKNKSFYETKIKNKNNSYQTLEEIIKEIKAKNDIFNNESINNITCEMVKESNKTGSAMKDLKKSFLFRSQKPKGRSNFYGILYYKKSNFPQIFSNKINK